MEIEVTDGMMSAWCRNERVREGIRAAVAASPLVAELERVTGERDEMRAKLAALESSPRVVVTREMAKRTMDEFYASSTGNHFDDMFAALQIVFGAAPEPVPDPVPAPIGERVTDVSTLREGDSVSFLGGDHDTLYTGTVLSTGDARACVECDDGLPAYEWMVESCDYAGPGGHRDLRLISRAPSTEPATPPSDEPVDADRVTHGMKCAQPCFDAVVRGEKTFEVRRNDRGFGGFRVGNELELREWDGMEYTGRRCTVVVTYVLQGGQYGIADGYCVMSIGKPGVVLGTKGTATPPADAPQYVTRGELENVVRPLLRALHVATQDRSEGRVYWAHARQALDALKGGQNV